MFAEKGLIGSPEQPISPSAKYALGSAWAQIVLEALLR
jgi:hypothetical protein